MKIQMWELRTKTLIIIIVLGNMLNLRAQTFALPFSLTQASPALTFSIASNGTFLETGPINTTSTLTLASGPQMLWFPAFGAFRAGSFTGSQTTIGQYSVAFGSGAIASGQYSTAFGGATASGQYSTALGQATASGTWSMGAGFWTSASGSPSTAMGLSAVATGQASTALGEWVTATSHPLVRTYTLR